MITMAIIVARTKGITPLNITPMGRSLEITLSVNSTTPIGGVRSPRFIVRTTSTPNHIGLTPKLIAIGWRMGTPIRSKGKMSIAKPGAEAVSPTGFFPEGRGGVGRGRSLLLNIYIARELRPREIFEITNTIS